MLRLFNYELLNVAKYLTIPSSAINVTKAKMSILTNLHVNLNYIILFQFLVSVVVSWDLSVYNISSDYYVSNIAGFGSRAFLSLPRSACNNNFTHLTLVEVSWNEYQNIVSRKNQFFYELQDWDNCNHLQNAVALDMEILRFRLWILDKGNEKCFPKLVIYNLFEKTNYSANMPTYVPQNQLSCILLDNDLKMNGPRAYFGISDESYLVIFSLMEFQWVKIFLQSTVSLPISTKFLTFSRPELLLYITGSHQRGIFSLKTKFIDIPWNDLILFSTLNVTYHGEKLGNSSGLLADLKNGLYYYIPRDFVVVRWDTRFLSEAAHYNIIAQSYDELPFVSQLYTGPQNGIFALINSGDLDDCNKLEKPFIQKARSVKLLKYNFL